ncbi:MAG TPA: hypothetical protein VL974_09060, partial [Magnetospirillum sp.]|nr:hypothetical protein [Magnetospirillum sp.]
MRYILTLLGLTAVALGAISAAMWRLDPYGYFGRFPLGLYTDGTFRHVKALLVNRSGADLAILGASTAVPINPADITGCRAFNAAFNGARPTELLYMVREVLPEGTKSVLMGLDFFAFNRATDNGY